VWPNMYLLLEHVLQLYFLLYIIMYIYNDSYPKEKYCVYVMRFTKSFPVSHNCHYY
jgi:hypothetical protein